MRNSYYYLLLSLVLAAIDLLVVIIAGFTSVPPAIVQTARILGFIGLILGIMSIVLLLCTEH